MNYQTELIEIEKKVNNVKLENVRLEERKRSLEEDQTKILKELKEEGIEKNKLKDVIMDLEISIEEELNKCKQILK